MNGKQTDMTSVDVTKFKDGKATEHWVYSDPNEMMKMMQSMPPMTAPAPADTTKAAEAPGKK